MEGLLIGLLYIVLYALVVALVIWVIIFVASSFGYPLPEQIQKILWAIGLVIVLIMLISLLFGWKPSFRLGAAGEPSGAIAAFSSAAA